MNLLLTLACVSPAPELDTAAPSADEPDDALVIVDVAGLPNRWIPAEGYTLSDPRAIGDVTGDGLDDAAVWVFDLEELRDATLIVATRQATASPMPGTRARAGCTARRWRSPRTARRCRTSSSRSRDASPRSSRSRSTSTQTA